MRQSAGILMLSLLLVGLSSCGGASTVGEPPNTEDSKGLVAFYLPSGWVQLASSQRSRFVREGADSENGMLGVDPSQRHPSLDLDTIWQNTKAKHEIQDQSLVREASSIMNGFEVREAVYAAERSGQEIVYHDYFLFSEALQIEVHLNATKEAHQRYESDLETLVRSVRELIQEQ